MSVPGGDKPGGTSSLDDVFAKLGVLFSESFGHEGFAEILVEFRILKRGQKEVILHSGKQYRYVVDADSALTVKPAAGG